MDVNAGLAAVEQAANRARLEQQAELLLSKARCRLLLGKDAKAAFFGQLVMRFRDEWDWNVPTACTDGRRLKINPEFWCNMTDDERVGVLTHETMHVVLRHFSRRGHRDPKVFNVAGDLAINEALIQAGFVLPKGALRTAQFKFPSDETTEWYYEHLPQDPNGGSGVGDGDDPGGCGGVMDSPSQAESTLNDVEWSAAVQSAAQAARSRGDMVGPLAELIGMAQQPRHDYKELLRRFMAERTRDDYSWSRPNRRLIHQGLYLPSLHSDRVGQLVVMIDASGSCFSAEIQSVFAGELEGIRQCHPVEIIVLYHDVEVSKVERIDVDEPVQFIRPERTGGTSHVDAFQWVAKNATDVKCVLALTDLETEFPPDPGIPVMWMTLGRATAPFGTVVRIDG